MLAQANITTTTQIATTHLGLCFGMMPMPASSSAQVSTKAAGNPKTIISAIHAQSGAPTNHRPTGRKTLSNLSTAQVAIGSEPLLKAETIILSMMKAKIAPINAPVTRRSWRPSLLIGKTTSSPTKSNHPRSPARPSASRAHETLPSPAVRRDPTRPPAPAFRRSSRTA